MKEGRHTEKENDKANVRKRNNDLARSKEIILSVQRVMTYIDEFCSSLWFHKIFCP